MNADGWKPDPSGKHELRFFDGRVWTNHVSDKGVQSTDEGIPTAGVPSGPAKRKRAWPGVLAGIVGLLVVVVVIAAAIGGDDLPPGTPDGAKSCGSYTPRDPAADKAESIYIANGDCELAALIVPAVMNSGADAVRADCEVATDHAICTQPFRGEQQVTTWRIVVR